MAPNSSDGQLHFIGYENTNLMIKLMIKRAKIVQGTKVTLHMIPFVLFEHWADGKPTCILAKCDPSIPHCL